MLDAATAIYNQVWTLLEANATFASTFRVGNRLKVTDNDNPFRDMAQTQPGCFPSVAIGINSQRLGVGAPRFFHGTSDTLPDYGVPLSFTLNFFIVHDTLDESVSSPAEAAVWNPLLYAGPRLGLSYISGSEFGTWQRRNEQFKKVLRLVSRSSLTVKAMPNRSALT